MTIVCPYRWNYVVIDLQHKKTNTCCKTDTEYANLNFDDAFLNNETQFQRRQEMIDGYKHSACSQCWKVEDNNGISWRLAAAQIPEEINSRQGVVSNYIDTLELILGNTCDMKCIYCSRHFSTQWAIDDLKNKRIDKQEYKTLTKDLSTEFMDYFWNWFDQKKDIIKHLQIKGGEPTIMPDFYKILDKVIDTDIKLFIVTNLNTPKKQFDVFLEKVKTVSKEKQFGINISMDTVGEHAERIRQGLSWNRFESNLHKLYELASVNKNIQINFITTMSTENLETHHMFIDYAFNLYKKYNTITYLNFNHVDWPNHLNPYNEENSVTVYLDKSIEKLETFIPQITDQSMLQRWKQYYEYTKDLKKIIDNNDKEVYNKI